LHPLLFMNVKPLLHRIWREWIRPLAVPLLLVTAAKSAIADINYVPTGSMKPTILEGDVVFINKLAYDLRVPFTFARIARWADPQPGDIVVCFSPADEMRLVKRIVGVPGDTVELRKDVLFLNGIRQNYTPLPAAFTRDMGAAERGQAIFAQETLGSRAHAIMALPGTPALRDFGPVQVPSGCYFVMGDNRDNSNDSRFFGFVARREIIGEARGVLVSANLDRGLQPRVRRFFTSLD
jgi:signal peptidase I